MSTEPQSLSIVRPAANAECVAALERLLEEAKRGEFDAILCFEFKDLPARFNFRASGNMPTEAVALMAIETYKFELLAARDKERNG